MPNEPTNGRGGARAGAGRKQSILHLDAKTAASFALLLSFERRVRKQPDLTADQLASELVEAKWAAIETAYGATPAPTEPFLL